MQINWKVRIKNKQFWLTLIPAVAVLVQTIAAVYGFAVDLTVTQAKLIAVVNALFVVLTIIGIVNDPTTATLNDSKRAMSYESPKEDGDA